MADLPQRLLQVAALVQAYAKPRYPQIIIAAVVLLVMLYVLKDLVAYLAIPSIYVDPSEGGQGHSAETVRLGPSKGIRQQGCALHCITDGRSVGCAVQRSPS